MRQFVCSKCGSTELAYSKYVKHTTPVILKNGVFHYGSSTTFDTKLYCRCDYGFCCNQCGTMLWHCGDNMCTETDLINYLNKSEEMLKEEEYYFNEPVQQCPEDEYPDNDNDDFYDDEHEDDDEDDHETTDNPS